LPGCAALPSYGSIACRLDMLIRSLDAAQDLGRLKSGLLTAATGARTKERKAGDLVATGKTKREKRAMKQAVAALETVLHKTSSHVARKLVSETTRKALIDQGNQILAEMKTLLGTM